MSVGRSADAVSEDVVRQRRGLAVRAMTEAREAVLRRLSRPRRAASRPAEVLSACIRRGALYRTCSRIELPGPDLLGGTVGAGFLLSGFLRGLRLRPLPGLSFGHAVFAFPSLLCGSSMVLVAKGPSRFIAYPAVRSVDGYKVELNESLWQSDRRTKLCLEPPKDGAIYERADCVPTFRDRAPPA